MVQQPVNIVWVVVLCLCGAGLTQLPEPAERRVRTAVHDLLMPGQVVGCELADRAGRGASWLLSRHSASAEEARVLRAHLAGLQARLQSTEIRCELFRTCAGEADVALEALRGEKSQALLVPAILEARVLGAEATEIWRGRRFVAAGMSHNVVESAIVLDASGILVDQGAAQQLSAGDAVYAGQAVVGKIVDVGRYSSRLQLVTDPAYTGRARLARRTSRGFEFGAEGTLAGNGDGSCRLKHIAEPVNVGDEVFTGGTDGILPWPMHYGQVVSASLEPGATEWTIVVKPAARLDRLEAVHILRLAVNPLRVLAN